MLKFPPWLLTDLTGIFILTQCLYRKDEKSAVSRMTSIEDVILMRKRSLGQHKIW